MSFVIIAIPVVWVVLFGAVYLARMVGGLSRGRSAAMVVGSYLGLSALALAWFGLNRTGLLSVIGMLLPCVAALGMIAYPARRL
jgi:hypothetical protein